MAAHPCMGKTFEVSHFSRMRVPLQDGKLINRLLETVMSQRLIEVCQPRLWRVVIRPGSC